MFTDILHRYFIKFSHSISKATRPLKQQLNIPFFGYHRIDLNGQYTVLTDRPDWAELYVEEENWRHDPFLKAPHQYSSGIAFLSHFCPKKPQPIIDSWRKKIQANDGLVLIQKDPCAVEFFIFAGNSQDPNFSKIFLNHLPLLHTFSIYFKKTMENILLAQQQEGYVIPLFNSKETIHPQIEDSKKREFLTAIGSEKIWKQASSLTPREKTCLKHLYQGHTLKGIALLLAISPRTVEYYLQNVKNKLNCWSKEELIAKASTFYQLDLLNNP